MAERTKLIEIPLGDYGWDLIFTCRTAKQVIVDITGYTPHFKVWRYNTPGTLLLNGTGTLVDATNGIAKYTLLITDFASSGSVSEVGEYEAELECTKAGEVSSYQSCRLKVLSSGQGK